MPGGQISNSIANPTPINVVDPLDHAEASAPVRSSLAGHVQASAPGQPRLGFFQSIGRGIKNALSRMFSSKQTSAARISTSEQRKADFGQSLGSVKDALLDKHATGESIANSLRSAEATARKLQYEDGGSLQLTREEFKQLLANTPLPELERLARTLAADVTSDAQQRVSGNPAAEHLLMELDWAVNAEIVNRVDGHVSKAIDTAIDLMKNGGTPERITDHLHHALDAAMPLARANVLGEGQREDDALHAADVTVKKQIAKMLGEVKDEPTLHGLLGHLSHHDLRALASATDTKDVKERALLSEIRHALESEIAARPQRMCAQLQNRAEQLAQRHGTGKPINARELIQELSAVNSEIKEMGIYNSLCRTGVPAELEGVKKSLLATMEGAVNSGSLNLKNLSPGEIRDLTAAFTALGARELGTKLLEPAQTEALNKRGLALGQSLEDLGLALVSPHHPEKLLKLLGKAAAAANEYVATCHAFSTPSQRIDGTSRLQGHIRHWLSQMSENDRQALRAALVGPNFNPLIADLGNAEGRARQMHQPSLAEEFKVMGALLSHIQSQAPSQVGAPPAASSPSPAAREPLRRAMTKLYGVTVTAERTKVNAGHFNVAQTEIAASEVEQPVSTNELNLDPLGSRMVSHQFIADARRGQPKIFMGESGSSSATPLIEYGKWDPRTPEAEVQRMIGDGYDKLLEFCGGDEAQARMLSSVLTQNVAAAPLIATMGEESPLTLEDGTVGTFAAEAEGGRKHVDITLSKSADGKPRLDISTRYEGRQVFLRPDGSHVTLSPDSHLEMNFTAELGNEGLRLLGAPSHRFNLKRDEFQKNYLPPTAESLRGMKALDDGVNDFLTYATPLGKDYQLTAVRAADTFAAHPTVARALDVIAECDRGGEDGAGLVSTEIREKVRAETENRRQGILSSFDGAVAAAQRIVDTRHGTGIAYFNAKHFLEEVQELRNKSGTALLEEAERLHREFVEQPAHGAAPADDRRTIPFNREVAAQTGQRLATERQAASQPAFAPDLFDGLIATLSQHLDTEVLPGMIEAVKRGEI